MTTLPYDNDSALFCCSLIVSIDPSHFAFFIEYFISITNNNKNNANNHDEC